MYVMCGVIITRVYIFMETKTSGPVPATVARPLPALEGSETVRRGYVEESVYVLADGGGRYVIATTSYGEFGRDHFLDLGEAAFYVSRRHFALMQHGGRLYIKDLGSRNGTWVNGVDIRGAGWVELKEGDVVEVGKAVALRVRRNKT